MIPWTDIEVRQMEHERRTREIEQNYWMRNEIEVKSGPNDRWHWRVRNALGSRLVTIGCRLQTHVETTRQAVLDGPSQSARPSP